MSSLGNAFEGAFTICVQAFHGELRRFAISADGKGDSTRSTGVFGLGVPGECIPVIMLHREGFALRAQGYDQFLALISNGNVAEETVAVRADICVGF